MKKVLAVGVALAGAGMLARYVAQKLGEINWEKKFESMPDNAPPKWMFRNITAIRENTERIITLLEAQPEQGAEGDGPSNGNGGEPVEGVAT